MKTCVLCPEKVKPKYKLCAACYKKYKDYIHEEWFIELVALQGKQDSIDRKEGYITYNIGANIYGTIDNAQTPSHKNVGRPSTDWRLVNEILELYDQSVEDELNGVGKRLSLRGMQKKVNNRVKYLTVRRILMTYRKDTFPKKKECL